MRAIWLWILFVVLVATTNNATFGQPSETTPNIPKSDTPPLNILLLYADDWRATTLGCAGTELVKTPNLDALARRGVRFTRNAVTTSICGVSRATLLTGQWMSRHGNFGFDMFKTPWSETFPALLRAHGYYVGQVGKWNNGKFPAENYDFGTNYSGRHWLTQPDGTRIHVTERNEKDALRFLETRPQQKPFCLTVAFFATHAEDPAPEQYLPQPWSESLYKDVIFPVPPNVSDAAYKNLPAFLQNDKQEGRRRWTLRFTTSDDYQRTLRNYYRMASEVDATCGKILAELDRQGLRDRTLVIFTTDNGNILGERGLADKWYPYEESIRVPLIIDDPRMAPEHRGTTCTAQTLNVDLAPTILAAAGQPPAPRMQGRDMSSLYLGTETAIDTAKADWRVDFFYEHPVIRDISFIPSSQALVTNTYKYIEWPDHGVKELFNLLQDPREQTNLLKGSVPPMLLETLQKRFEQLKAAAR